MSTFFYQSKPQNTTQAYLGSVKVCLCCRGQKPKQTFKIVRGQELCKDCQEEK